MDRHRGDRDRYSGNGNYNEESYHNRRPSRFSDAPPRFSDAPPRFSDAPPRFSDAPPRFSDAPPRFSDVPPRFSDAPPRFSDAPPRFSDAPPQQFNRYPDNAIDTDGSFNHRSPSSYRGGGPAVGRRPFESPPGHAGGMGDGGGFGSGFRPIGGGGFGPMDAGGFRPIDSGGGEGFGPNYQVPPPRPPPQPLSGQKRGFPFAARGSSPDRIDGGNFAKLFVGSVPRTATEQDIRPLFEEHGNVIEVALIKDKRTGQQQGCCFIKYANAEEADRAIRALHNHHTLPGGVAPIQVRYADGERERLGAVEYKLFVGSLHKQATEKEIEEIFLPYGRVEDVYLMRDDMKQSRGCGFVKYSHRDMALAAINALNGTFTMRGCDQPLTVRFADPKRPRAGDSRAPPFGGPGSGPRFQAPGPRPAHNFGDPVGDRNPPNAWHPMSPPNMGPSSDSAVRGFGSQLPPRSGDLAMPLNQSFNQPLHQIPPVSQQISPLQKPLQSPQQLPPTFQLQAQSKSSYSQAQASHTSQTPFSQAPSVQHLPASQPLLQQGIPSTTALQAPSNNGLPSRSLSAAMNQHHPASVQQPLISSLQQPPSDLAQMLSQQRQTLQASFQSSQQAFSKLQQQLQMIQPPNQNLPLQQNSQQTQHQWSGIAPQMNPHNHATTTGDVTPSTAPTAAVATQTAPSAKCNWSEHTSPEGFKYYYNSITNESKWEKPEELTLFEKQQQPQQLQPKPLVQQSQTQPNHPVQATQQVSQAQPMQPHPQIQSQFRQQQPAFSSPYGASGPRGQQDGQELGYTQLPPASTAANNPSRFQGGQPAQEWMWKSKPAGI